MRELMKAAQKIQDQIVKWRRHFHRYPEIGAEVPETAAYIVKTLKEMGVEVRENVGGMGVVGLIRGKGDKTFAIRADIDALEMTEETGVPYASEYPARMHACGHDGHAAIALGVARVLTDIKDTLPGNVKILFQPAEEGIGGAEPMIKDGALENPRVDAIIGLHLGVMWDIPSGVIGYHAGPTMASSDSFQVEIKGKGGHGAKPENTVDAILVASQVVTSLQTVVSRKVNPLKPAVISVGIFQAGTMSNIIAEKALLKATVRSLDEEVREALPGHIEDIISGVCKSMGADYDLKYKFNYPVLYNDGEFTHYFAKVAREVLGEKRVMELPGPTMGSEDMGYFLREVPGTFFALGSGTEEKGTAYPHHNPRFNIDEEVLWIGSGLFAEVAFRWLEENCK